mgnify:CR=1 FL=1
MFCCLFCSENNNSLVNTELFAEQLLEITTQVMREDDCGMWSVIYLYPARRKSGTALD